MTPRVSRPRPSRRSRAPFDPLSVEKLAAVIIHDEVHIFRGHFPGAVLPTRLRVMTRTVVSSNAGGREVRVSLFYRAISCARCGFLAGYIVDPWISVGCTFFPYNRECIMVRTRPPSDRLHVGEVRRFAGVSIPLKHISSPVFLFSLSLVFFSFSLFFRACSLACFGANDGLPTCVSRFPRRTNKRCFSSNRNGSLVEVILSEGISCAMRQIT